MTGAGVGNTNMTSAAATRPKKNVYMGVGNSCKVYEGFRSSASEP